jgi:hypothetical protein
VAEAALIREDHIVTAQVETAEGQRIKRQVGLVVAMDAGQPIDERDPDRPAAVGRRHLVGPVDGGEHRRARVHIHHCFEHILGAAELVEPVVD